MPRFSYDGSVLLLGFERLTGASAMGALLALHRALVVKPAGVTEQADAAIRATVALLFGLGLCVCGCCACAVSARAIRLMYRIARGVTSGRQGCAHGKRA